MIKRFARTIPIAALLIMGAIDTAAAQNKTGSRIESSAEGTSPHIIITFDGISDGDGYRDVLLRLHNDTGYDLTLEVQGFQFKDGRLVDSDELLDGGRVGLKFKLQDIRTGDVLEPLETDTPYAENHRRSLLRYRDTVVFRVSARLFSKRFDIIVPFRYAGDDDGVEHRAYFNAYDLPAKKTN